jgi:hypothetical protein
MKLEIIQVNESFAIRNAETKNFVIPGGLKTLSDAEKALREVIAKATLDK